MSLPLQPQEQMRPAAPAISRRNFMHRCAAGTVAFTGLAVLTGRGFGANASSTLNGPAVRTMPLDDQWLFGGKFDPAALAPQFDDRAFASVSLPHCVTKLSWQKWNPATWQHVWVYRRHFTVPVAWQGMRVFLHFDGVMVGATPAINGHALSQHLGGYLPFRYEITAWLQPGENVLAVAVDARWSQVPPEGSPKGSSAVDFLEAGGIHRPVRLQAVPPVFIADVFAKPVRVLHADRRVEVACALDAASLPQHDVRVRVELHDQGRVVARTERAVSLERIGVTDVGLTLSNPGDIGLWEPDSPRLYRVVTTLLVDGSPTHNQAVRIGFREARFELGGFFLNGRRFQLFGLNRHEVFPYAGFAMPRRVMRRDAEILRRDFNCNAVRCSHYPQSPAFLDACDELGLMVFEEMPGWHFIGDAAWQELALRDMQDMVRRDRNRPSIILWGARINESPNNPPFYDRIRAACYALDDSRQTSGAMSLYSTDNWAEDVYAKNDYHAPADILAPLPGVPYLITETVGQFNYDKLKGFDFKYRRTGDPALLRRQGLLHARGHSNAAANPRIAGVIAWCAFDYASERNAADNVKCPGVADVFRIPKLGAGFYLAQGDPRVRPVIAPGFYWDFGPRTPRGPGKGAAIFSNCERLDVFIGGRQHASLQPDAINYPRVKHPPFFADLEFDGAGRPELRIDGYVGGRLALSRSFSADPAADHFSLEADDATLGTGEPDATRIVFKVVDKFGAERAGAGGTVAFELSGPGTLVGDNPFSLAESGGVGAIWVRTAPGRTGRIVVRARHSQLGERSVRIDVRSGAGRA